MKWDDAAPVATHAMQTEPSRAVHKLWHKKKKLKKKEKQDFKSHTRLF